MRITIEAEAKEIAALVLEIQERPDSKKTINEATIKFDIRGIERQFQELEDVIRRERFRIKPQI